MQRTAQQRLLALIAALTALLAACTNQPGGDPGAAVKDYLQAMVSGQADRIGALVCPAYEAEARTEFDSFGAVEAELDNVECRQSGAEGGTALVTCTGSIKVNYTGEIRALELKDNVYRARPDNGRWQMCGYQ